MAEVEDLFQGPQPLLVERLDDPQSFKLVASRIDVNDKKVGFEYKLADQLDNYIPPGDQLPNFNKDQWIDTFHNFNSIGQMEASNRYGFVLFAYGNCLVMFEDAQIRQAFQENVPLAAIKPSYIQVFSIRRQDQQVGGLIKYVKISELCEDKYIFLHIGDKVNIYDTVKVYQALKMNMRADLTTIQRPECQVDIKPTEYIRQVSFNRANSDKFVFVTNEKRLYLSSLTRGFIDCLEDYTGAVFNIAGDLIIASTTGMNDHIQFLDTENLSSVKAMNISFSEYCSHDFYKIYSMSEISPVEGHLMLYGVIFTDQDRIDDNYGKLFYIWVKADEDFSISSNWTALKQQNKVKFAYQIVAQHNSDDDIPAFKTQFLSSLDQPDFVAVHIAMSHREEIQSMLIKNRVMANIFDYSGTANNEKQAVKVPNENSDSYGQFQGFNILRFKINGNPETLLFNTGDDEIDLSYPPLCLIYGISGSVLSFNHIVPNEWMNAHLLWDKQIIPATSQTIQPQTVAPQKQEEEKTEESKATLPKQTIDSAAEAKKKAEEEIKQKAADEEAKQKQVQEKLKQAHDEKLKREQEEAKKKADEEAKKKVEEEKQQQPPPDNLFGLGKSTTASLFGNQAAQAKYAPPTDSLFGALTTQKKDTTPALQPQETPEQKTPIQALGQAPLTSNLFGAPSLTTLTSQTQPQGSLFGSQPEGPSFVNPSAQQPVIAALNQTSPFPSSFGNMGAQKPTASLFGAPKNEIKEEPKVEAKTNLFSAPVIGGQTLAAQGTSPFGATSMFGSQAKPEQALSLGSKETGGAPPPGGLFGNMATQQQVIPPKLSQPAQTLLESNQQQESKSLIQGKQQLPGQSLFQTKPLIQPPQVQQPQTQATQIQPQSQTLQTQIQPAKPAQAQPQQQIEPAQPRVPQQQATIPPKPQEQSLVQKKVEEMDKQLTTEYNSAQVGFLQNLVDSFPKFSELQSQLEVKMKAESLARMYSQIVMLNQGKRQIKVPEEVKDPRYLRVNIENQTLESVQDVTRLQVEATKINEQLERLLRERKEIQYNEKPEKLQMDFFEYLVKNNSQAIKNSETKIHLANAFNKNKDLQKQINSLISYMKFSNENLQKVQGQVQLQMTREQQQQGQGQQKTVGTPQTSIFQQPQKKSYVVSQRARTIQNQFASQPVQNIKGQSKVLVKTYFKAESEIILQKIVKLEESQAKASDNFTQNYGGTQQQYAIKSGRCGFFDPILDEAPSIHDQSYDQQSLIGQPMNLDHKRDLRKRKMQALKNYEQQQDAQLQLDAIFYSREAVRVAKIQQLQQQQPDYQKIMNYFQQSSSQGFDIGRDEEIDKMLIGGGLAGAASALKPQQQTQIGISQNIQGITGQSAQQAADQKLQAKGGPINQLKAPQKRDSFGSLNQLLQISAKKDGTAATLAKPANQSLFGTTTDIKSTSLLGVQQNPSLFAQGDKSLTPKKEKEPLNGNGAPKKEEDGLTKMPGGKGIFDKFSIGDATKGSTEGKKELEATPIAQPKGLLSTWGKAQQPVQNIIGAPPKTEEKKVEQQKPATEIKPSVAQEIKKSETKPEEQAKETKVPAFLAAKPQVLGQQQDASKIQPSGTQQLQPPGNIFGNINLGQGMSIGGAAAQAQSNLFKAQGETKTFGQVDAAQLAAQQKAGTQQPSLMTGKVFGQGTTVVNGQGPATFGSVSQQVPAHGATFGSVSQPNQPATFSSVQSQQQPNLFQSTSPFSGQQHTPTTLGSQQQLSTTLVGQQQPATFGGQQAMAPTSIYCQQQPSGFGSLGNPMSGGTLFGGQQPTGFTAGFGMQQQQQQVQEFGGALQGGGNIGFVGAGPTFDANQFTDPKFKKARK